VKNIATVVEARGSSGILGTGGRGRTSRKGRSWNPVHEGAEGKRKKRRKRGSVGSLFCRFPTKKGSVLRATLTEEGEKGGGRHGEELLNVKGG